MRSILVHLSERRLGFVSGLAFPPKQIAQHASLGIHHGFSENVFEASLQHQCFCRHHIRFTKCSPLQIQQPGLMSAYLDIQLPEFTQYFTRRILAAMLIQLTEVPEHRFQKLGLRFG